MASECSTVMAARAPLGAEQSGDERREPRGDGNADQLAVPTVFVRRQYERFPRGVGRFGRQGPARLGFHRPSARTMTTAVVRW